MIQPWNGWFQASEMFTRLPAAAVIAANSELPNHLLHQVQLSLRLSQGLMASGIYNTWDRGPAEWLQGCLHLYLARTTGLFVLAVSLFCACLIVKPVTG